MIREASLDTVNIWSTGGACVFTTAFKHYQGWAAGDQAARCFYPEGESRDVLTCSSA